MGRPKPSPSEPVELEVSVTAELETVYRRHGRWLFDVLRRRFGRESAEELSQETYVRVAASTGGLRNPRAFLVRVALNVARDQARRRAARPQPTLLVEEVRGLGSAAEQDDLLAVKDVVLSLPRELRDVLVLSRFGGLTYEEIARERGVSVQTVQLRMTRALTLLQSRLEG